MIPGLRVVADTQERTTDDASKDTLQKIVSYAPVILAVAYGAPAQEQWIADHLPHLPSVRVAIGVGGSFDMLAGDLPRAPRWLQRRGMEWLWRLVQQPRRIRRIVRATVHFPLMVLRDTLRSSSTV